MSKQHQQQTLSPEKYIRTRARSLPIGTCYINDNWQDSGLALIFVGRRHIHGHVTHAGYIVDMYCLGLKESFWTFNQDPIDFKDFMERQQKENPLGIHLLKTDYTLVHNIIYGAIEYAGEFGFLPHKSFDTSRYILEEDDDDVEFIDLTFGFKGKPLYISSPGNPAERNRVLAHLDKNPGKGNYEFITENQASEFFEKEYEKEREEANYHDPEIKRGIITDFITFTGNPKKFLFTKAAELKKILELSNTVFYEYMVKQEDLDKASETIAGLFDFNISDSFFSDEMLKGIGPATVSPEEIRIQAERLLSMANEGRTTDGQRQSRAMMDKYPQFPVFTYLYMRIMEQKEGLSKLLTKLEIYLIQYPHYLPLAYMYAMSFLLNKPEDISRQIGDSLHMKNFYPDRKTFCKEEVLLYVHLLTLNYSNSGEFTLIEEIITYFDSNFPGVMPESQILTAKLVKVPFVQEWCRKWMEKPRILDI